MSVQSNSPFSCPNMLRGICFCLFCCGRLYQKKAKTCEKLKMAVFFASVVPSPLTNRFSSSTLDQSLIYHYSHCPVRICGRHFENKSPHSDKPLKEWFGPAVYNIKKQLLIFNAIRKSVEKLILNIRQVESARFLGVQINRSLTWKNQITNICNKIAKTTGILCRVRHYLLRNVMRGLYDALIHPYLSWTGKGQFQKHNMFTISKCFYC